jgi:hypothetical protein
MAYSGHSNTSRRYSLCCLYDQKQNTCGIDGVNVQLYDTAQLNNHYSTVDGEMVARELELLATRCRKDETQIKFICPKHRLDFSWKQDDKQCNMIDCSSRVKCSRVGRNASIQIRKVTPYANFPIRKFSDVILKHLYHQCYHL